VNQFAGQQKIVPHQIGQTRIRTICGLSVDSVLIADPISRRRRLGRTSSNCILLHSTHCEALPEAVEFESSQFEVGLPVRMTGEHLLRLQVVSKWH
jgi:hypothetical protein